MAQYDRVSLPHWLCRGYHFILAFFWFSGCLCGIAVSVSAGDSLFSLMRSIPFGTVSIVSLLFTAVFPFLFSAFAVSFCRPILILMFCFLKSFLFSFISMGILKTFGSAGWLFQYILLFCDCFSLPVLYFWGSRRLDGIKMFHGWEAFGVILLAILIGNVDYCVISPLLACLIEL